MDVLPTLPAGSVHTVVTSPPYFALRDYGTGQWEGGDAECDHRQAGTKTGDKTTLRNDGRAHTGPYENENALTVGFPYKDTCGKCGARRIDRQIGLEPTPAEFVQTMVRVFREVKRVLRDDGTCWVNLGDSYAGAGYSNFQNTNENVGKYNLQREDGSPGRKVPQGMKPKDLMMIPARVAIALQDDGWYLRSDIAWCLSGGTRLYARTQKGDMPATLKDLVRLDPATVQLWNGERWTQVTAWTQSLSRDNAIEITLRSGERIGCTPEHLWPTQRGNVRADQLMVGDIIPTCELPEPERPNVPAALDDRLVGWFVGLYLAEGFTDSKSIRIAGHKKEAERLEKCKQIAAAFGGTCTIRNTSDNGAMIRIHSRILKAIIETYVNGVGAAGKHLTSAAWQRSNIFLDALLRGYLEGDAHYEPANNRYRLGFTNNDAWAGDLRTLAARLGYSCRLRRCQHQMGDRRFPGWRGEIRFSVGHTSKPNGEIVGIGRSRARQFWDVSVANEPHLFALASGVLTHNCKRAPMPESVTDRPTSAWEHIFLLTKKASYFYDAEAVREKSRTPIGLTWEQRKALAPGKNEGVEWRNDVNQAYAGTLGDGVGANQRNFWLLSPEPFPAAHFATFPTEIPRRAILAGTSEHGCCAECGAPWRRLIETHYEPHGPSAKAQVKTTFGERSSGDLQNGALRPQEMPFGRATRIDTTTGWAATCPHNAPIVPCTVLDCFAGAGTSLLVANRLGRRGIGIELNPAYVEMARKRIIGDAPLFAWADGVAAL